jgi:hypothetical protein
MRNSRRYLIAGLFIATISSHALAAAQTPSPWRLVKQEADSARASIDRSVAHSGTGSARLIVERRTGDDVAVLQPLRGGTWQGRRMRLSGFVLATMTSGEASLVAIVNNGTRFSAFFPSQERIKTRQTGWRLLSVTVDVPVDATLISIGVWIRHGNGSVWLDDVTFEEIPHGSGVATEPRRSSPMTQHDLTRIRSAYEVALDRPSDLDFEAPSNMIDVWSR